MLIFTNVFSVMSHFVTGFPRGDKVKVKDTTDQQSALNLTTRQGQRAYLEGAWPYLAGLAWQAYKRKGRGALAILLSEIQAVPVTGGKGTMHAPVRYITEATSPSGKLPVSAAQLVKFYDPNRAIVVLFFTSNGEFSNHYIEQPQGQLSPPQAYATKKNAMARPS